MSGRLVLDTIQGAEVEIGTTNGRVIRTGTVTEIDANATADSGVIFGALTADGMPILGQTTYPGTNLIFNRLLIRGFTTNGVYVALYYETFQGIIPSAYIIRDHSSMSSRTLTHDPISKKGLRVSYSGSDGTQYGTGPNPAYYPSTIPQLKDVLCSVDVLMPVRSISITKVTIGHPNVPARDVFGRVNDSDWPGATTSAIAANGIAVINNLWTSPAPVGGTLPIGYWLLSKIDTDWSRYQNYFTTEIEAISYVNHDWSHLCFARDTSTGLYARPADAALSAILTPAYAQGVTRDDANGILRFGPYLTTNFKSVFGF